jgi:hypothetical protein
MWAFRLKEITQPCRNLRSFGMALHTWLLDIALAAQVVYVGRIVHWPLAAVIVHRSSIVKIDLLPSHGLQ